MGTTALKPATTVRVASTFYVSGELSEVRCPLHLPKNAIVDGEVEDYIAHPERCWSSAGSYMDTSADTPSHCGDFECMALLPHPLTLEGRQYVLQAVHANTGDTAVLAAWAEYYAEEIGRPYVGQLFTAYGKVLYTVMWAESEDCEAWAKRVREICDAPDDYFNVVTFKV